MSNWQLFRRSLANHPGLTLGYGWPILLAAAMLFRGETPPLIFWLTVWPAFSALPWLAILYTAWTLRKQYDEKETEHE
ncbi:MAG: hypothetical protein WBX27_01170 [Specibacter sp.]